MEAVEGQRAGLGQPLGSRPAAGWHIECSAMSMRTASRSAAARLRRSGEVFDIHGGGIDLVFPHHENEIAQSRCAFGTTRMANVWMHNGFLQVEGEKMSKSLGNFITIHDLLHSDKFGGTRLEGRGPAPGHAAHAITASRSTGRSRRSKKPRKRSTLVRAAARAETAPGDLSQTFPRSPLDDLNTPKAHRRTAPARRGRAEADKVLRAAQLLGLLQTTRRAGTRKTGADIDTAAVEKLVAERLEPARAKNFAESDRLRDVLVGMGVKLKDAKNKQTGEPETTWEVRLTAPLREVARARMPRRTRHPTHWTPKADAKPRRPRKILARLPSLPGALAVVHRRENHRAGAGGLARPALERPDLMPENIALRPALPADAPALAALFRASVEVLGVEDYSVPQVEAWSALADDEAAFAQKLAERLTIVGLVGGAIASVLLR